MNNYIQKLFVFVSVSVLLSVRPAFAQEEFGFGERYAVIIAGVGGQELYSNKCYEQGKRMYDLLVFELSYNTQNVFFAAEDPSVDPDRINGVASERGIRRVFDNLKARLQPADQLFVFLVGHGSYDGMWAKFNIVGPDLRDMDYAELLVGLPSQKVIFVNSSSASGPFIDRLSAQDRVIITATKNGYENNETTFAEFFMDGLLSTEADLNKDGRVSIFEAFEFACTTQENRYEERRQIRVEHPLLDDNGDGRGSQQKDEEAEDGMWAARAYLGPVSVEVQESLHRVKSGTQTPRDELNLRKAALEVRIEDLKAKKAQMDAEDYASQLEVLLIELARVNKQVKELE